MTSVFPTAEQSEEFDTHVDRLGDDRAAALVFGDRRHYEEIVYGFDALSSTEAETTLPSCA